MGEIGKFLPILGNYIFQGECRKKKKEKVNQQNLIMQKVLQMPTKEIFCGT